MRPDRAFFDLQVRFAEGAARIAGMPLEAALIDYTNLYVRFGAGRAFDAAHPLWAAYVQGVRACADLRGLSDWTWAFYADCPAHLAAPPLVATFGCFGWARDPHGGVRLHFDPRGAGEGANAAVSPLDTREAPRRRAELRRLVEHVRAHAGGGDPLVHGTSWLYNLPAYQRLFPPAYLATSQAVDRPRALSLWGQFLDRRGQLRHDAAQALLARLAKTRDVSAISRCFALHAVAVQAPLSVFYAHLPAVDRPR
ncbi:hypothetical protein LMG28688_03926 [Paraburkholderia caffeinitolerans]|uniref:Uncharacterized protein n=1 Tax=Paraburkholderia caffeinitolerans TaxID=1723730 RepID=A0A6J5G694_9BURK|nr:hypothetical protein [Paraburkholderia caffeinitolerans]CAB3794388.1 hypothetical protein LMG28688_03926 [Paraburkholderia caffeinitolerans]